MSRWRIWYPVDWLGVFLMCRILAYWRWRTGRKMYVATFMSAEELAAGTAAHVGERVH